MPPAPQIRNLANLFDSVSAESSADFARIVQERIGRPTTVRYTTADGAQVTRIARHNGCFDVRLTVEVPDHSSIGPFTLTFPFPVATLDTTLAAATSEANFYVERDSNLHAYVESVTEGDPAYALLLARNGVAKYAMPPRGMVGDEPAQVQAAVASACAEGRRPRPGTPIVVGRLKLRFSDVTCPNYGR